MITLFTTGKPFKGQAAVAQMNALASWKALDPSVEVLLFGDSEGAAEVAAELGLVHVPEVGTNQFGTPLVRSMVDVGAQRGRYDIQAYVNCDIILLDDFLPAVRRVTHERFLLVGRRWDLDVPFSMAFNGDWIPSMRSLLRDNGVLHPPAGSDYFVYRRGTFPHLPPFAVGRNGWDNWMIYHTLMEGIPVVDGTSAITAVHQDHPRTRLEDGGPDRNVENDLNEREAAASSGISLVHANWTLSGGGVRRKRSLRHRLETAGVLHILHPRIPCSAAISRVARQWIREMDRRLPLTGVADDTHGAV